MHQIDHDYVASLEMELAKMLMFRGELPLSIELVSRAIESCKQKLSSGEAQQQNLCELSSSDETASDGERVLQFIPIKKPTYESSSESEQTQHDLTNKDASGDVDETIEKSAERLDWLKSVQLWNQTTDLPTNESEEKQSEDTTKSAEKQGSPESCSKESKESEKVGRKKEDKEGSSQRKQRRCWSQDLHRRFLNSLQQLGGAHVATPKQIRELMKVDGLTNDEVKSHLQKYRLHTRRPTPPPSQNNTQTPRFVVVGGLWPQPMALTPTISVNREANGAPGAPKTLATPPVQPHMWQEQFNQKPQNNKSKKSDGNGDGLARCISTSMSSSTRATASHVY